MTSDLGRFLETGPEDYEDPDAWDAEYSYQIGKIQGVCVWRAFLLGMHIGRFMSAVEDTFKSGYAMWLQWRAGDEEGTMSRLVGGLAEEDFINALTARNLLLAGHEPKRQDGALWLPAVDDLFAVPGVLHVDNVKFDDWVEVFGEPPDDLNPFSVLYLAEKAAIGEVLEARRTTLGPDVQERFDRMV